MLADQTYRFEHDLLYYECNRTGRMSMEMMLALMIAASEKQNQDLGFDEDNAKKSGGGWVIINYETSIEKPLPIAGDHIVIETRIAAFNRFFVMREWQLFDQAGELVAKVRGLFAFMDLTKRRMAPIPEAMLGTYADEAVKRMPRLKFPAKLEAGDDWTRRDYRVRFFDIDANGHVNNARYFEWLLDALPADFLLHYRPVAFSMNYHREVRLGETVTSQASPVEVGPNVETSHHRIEIDGQLCALADFSWEKI